MLGAHSGLSLGCNACRRQAVCYVSFHVGHAPTARTGPVVAACEVHCAGRACSQPLAVRTSQRHDFKPCSERAVSAIHAWPEILLVCLRCCLTWDATLGDCPGLALCHGLWREHTAPPIMHRIAGPQAFSPLVLPQLRAKGIQEINASGGKIAIAIRTTMASQYVST